MDEKIILWQGLEDDGSYVSVCGKSALAWWLKDEWHFVCGARLLWINTSAVSGSNVGRESILTTILPPTLT